MSCRNVKSRLFVRLFSAAGMFVVGFGVMSRLARSSAGMLAVALREEVGFTTCVSWNVVYVSVPGGGGGGGRRYRSSRGRVLRSSGVPLLAASVLSVSRRCRFVLLKCFQKGGGAGKGAMGKACASCC